MSGGPATASRPALALRGGVSMVFVVSAASEAAPAFADPGADCISASGAQLTVHSSGDEPQLDVPGTYHITYACQDSATGETADGAMWSETGGGGSAAWTPPRREHRC